MTDLKSGHGTKTLTFTYSSNGCLVNLRSSGWINVLIFKDQANRCIIKSVDVSLLAAIICSENVNFFRDIVYAKSCHKGS